MHYYLEALEKYAVFSGRARRSEYWYFVLFNSLAVLALALVGRVAGRAIGANELDMELLPQLYVLATFVPNLAVSVRRLHDIGMSGWWVLISLVPLIGTIWLLVLFVQDSQPGTNDFGANPKALAGG